MRFNALRLATFLALGALPAVAQEFKAGDITIERPWSRATPKGTTVAAGYLVIRNDGAAPDKLTGGSADFAGNVQIHEMSMNNGVMRMQELKTGPDIPAHGKVVLSPGGYHVMFSDLKRPLTKGEKVKAILTFEHAGTLPIEFKVGGVGDTGPEGTGKSGGSMKGMKM